KRNFNADHPDQLWVSDFTYIQTHSGGVYTAFIIDVEAFHFLINFTHFFKKMCKIHMGCGYFLLG
ncbi:hypothetical protein, partial [Acinetobacter towneri]|uniref:hypothetical protein n=1 Tax=Acinetobacter towneri TaxID=202956 RepID=UPI001CE0682D